MQLQQSKRKVRCKSESRNFSVHPSIGFPEKTKRTVTLPKRLFWQSGRQLLEHRYSDGSGMCAIANRELMLFVFAQIDSTHANARAHKLMNRGGVVTFGAVHARSILVGLCADNVCACVCVCNVPTNNLNESHTCLMRTMLLWYVQFHLHTHTHAPKKKTSMSHLCERA